MLGYSKAVGPCLLVVLMGGFCGCASNGNTRDAKPRAAAVDMHAENQWHMRLESDDKAEKSEPFEVSGRRMVLKKVAFDEMQIQPDGSRRSNQITYYGQNRLRNIHLRAASALLDADTGQEILPMDYAIIVPVPGHAVYVMTAQVRSNLENKAQQIKWHELDVATGELKQTDISDVFVVPPTYQRRSKGIVLEPQKHAVAVMRVDPDSTPAAPLTQMKVFPSPASGVEAATYTRIKGPPRSSSWYTAGRYLKFNRVEADGMETTVLLDNDGTFCLETDQTVQVFTHNRQYNNRHDVFTTLAIAAPGTDATDDLWLILDDSGRFGAPAGTLGFRPLYTYWTAKDGAKGHASSWLVRYAVEGEERVKWEALDSEFKPRGGNHQYVEAVLFESPWFYPPTNKYEKGDTRNRPLLAIMTGSGSWELHAGDFPPDLTNSRRRLLLSGRSLESLRTGLETKLEKDLIAYAAYEKAKAEKERLARVAALERNFYTAINNKSWSTAGGLAGQLGGDAYYRLAKAMPGPSVLFLQRAIERTSSQTYKNDLKKMLAEAQVQYSRQLAEHQSWQQQQTARRSFTGGGAVSSYQPSAAPPKTMAQYMHDHAQAQRYKDAASYSQHKVNMGWYRPSGY